MPSGVVRIEGKEISLDQQVIDAGIPAIKAVLSVEFPDVENADIEIVSPSGGGAPKVATVVKRGTGKGTDPVSAHLRSGRSLPLNHGTVEEVLRRDTGGMVTEFLRKRDAAKPGHATVTCRTLRGKCDCGNQHPDEH